jgi:hypothetical protein
VGVKVLGAFPPFEDMAAPDFLGGDFFSIIFFFGKIFLTFDFPIGDFVVAMVAPLNGWYGLPIRILFASYPAGHLPCREIIYNPIIGMFWLFGKSIPSLIFWQGVI